jgi:hypothetical protein
VTAEDDEAVYKVIVIKKYDNAINNTDPSTQFVTSQQYSKVSNSIDIFEKRIYLHI